MVSVGASGSRVMNSRLRCSSHTAIISSFVVIVLLRSKRSSKNAAGPQLAGGVVVKGRSQPPSDDAHNLAHDFLGMILQCFRPLPISVPAYAAATCAASALRAAISAGRDASDACPADSVMTLRAPIRADIRR